MTPDRRRFLRFGLGSLALAETLRLRAAAGGTDAPTAVILVWLRGGCSHLDTFDPKPDAGSEFASPFKPLATSAPGVRVTELLPGIAKQAHRFALLRSMAHTGGGHPAGSLQVLSGDPDRADKMKPGYPDWMCVANRLRSGTSSALPHYVGVNPVSGYDGFGIAGGAYLGSAYEPFAVMGDPSSPTFRVPNLRSDAIRTARVNQRTSLRARFDGMRRDIDGAGVAAAMDRFDRQALDMLTSPAAARAFDLSLESPRVRERYGLNAWGQQLLMARRLVEAGVGVVTSTLDGPLCGRVANWDDHAVNHHIFDALKFRAPTFDRAVSALIEDVFDRGLDRRVLVIVGGEFGRTPRIERTASSGGGVASGATGVVQPGRDHWPAANTMLFAGGGVRGGQAIGATDRKGEQVVSRRVGRQDFLATIYRHLGIDWRKAALPDFTGRPIPIVRDGEAIAELAGG